VLRRHIDPVVALHAVINRARLDDFLRQSTLRHSGLRIRIGPVRRHIGRAAGARAIYQVIETMHRAGLQRSGVVPEIALSGARHRPAGAIVDVNLGPCFRFNGPDKIRPFPGKRRPLLQLLVPERGAQRVRKSMRLLASQLDQLRRRKLVGSLCRKRCERHDARKNGPSQKRLFAHGSVLYVNRDFMTERLYYTDSYLQEFHARVLDRTPDGATVYLDRTAFYPTSGGQPYDTGSIAGSAVVDVIDEGERIAHRIAS